MSLNKFCSFHNFQVTGGILTSIVFLIACQPGYDTRKPPEKKIKSENSSSTSTASSTYKNLLRKAREDGTVRVIVELRVNHAPEGNLSDTAIKRQRNTINTVQKKLLRDLQKTNFKVNRKYDLSPLIALTLRPQALQLLKEHPDVRRLNPDETGGTF